MGGGDVGEHRLEVFLWFVPFYLIFHIVFFSVAFIKIFRVGFFRFVYYGMYLGTVFARTLVTFSSLHRCFTQNFFFFTIMIT